MSRFALTVVHAYSRFWMTKLNQTRVINRDILVEHVFNRPKNVPLITVSNHASCMDDPHLWATLPSLQSARWVPGARELIFTRLVQSIVFGFGRVVPVVRGYGVYQKAMDFTLDRLNEGGWTHIYPEGKVREYIVDMGFLLFSQVNESGELMRLKWGVGRWISDCMIPPIVVPIWHVGMDDVLPNRKPYIPRMFKRVTILIEEPLNFVEMLARHRQTQTDALTQRKEITDVIEATFARMRQKAIEMHQEWEHN